MLTKIAELDDLLGMDQNQPWPAQGPVMLIRGGPGAGKTTLALQILSNHISCSASRQGILISLETSPDIVISRAKKGFNLNKLDCDQVYKISRTQMEECVLQARGSATEGVVPISNNLVASQYASIVLNATKTILSNIERRSTDLAVLVVDSINVLIDIIRVTHFNSPEMSKDRRAIVAAFVEASREWAAAQSRNILLIFTGEYQASKTDGADTTHESFLCDIEILLTSEPVIGVSRTSPDAMAALGYSIELHHGTSSQLSDSRQIDHSASIHAALPSSQGLVTVESRSFLRVLKNRDAKHQFRRCSYDIVSNVGLKFNDIYPGDGYLLLFAENERQHHEWADFLAHSISHEFPALRTEIFGRKALQRTFGTQRRLQRRGQATDLYMASFDTYWIAWYEQLQRRIEIATACRPVLDWINSSQDVSLDARRRFGSRLIASVDHAMSVKDSDSEQMLVLALSRLRQMEKSSALIPVPGAQIKSEIDWIDAIDRKLLGKCIEDALQCLCPDNSIFLQLPESDLRLFGEQCSPIITELRSPKGASPPIWASGSGSHSKLLSVPYNANVSFLVFRGDISAELDDRDRVELGKRAWDLRRRISKDLEVFFETTKFEPARIGATLWHNPAGLPRMSKTKLGEKIEDWTWEEIISFCDERGRTLLIETQTFDTFLCAFLEIFWGCGGKLVVNRDYFIEDPAETAYHMLEAVLLLKEMFSRGVIPRNSTLDPFAGSPAVGSGVSDWAFARHWYSTFVDVLTAHESGKFVWPQKGDQSDRVALNLRSMPVTSRYLGFVEAEARRTGESIRAKTRIACWGEWHLGALRASENHALAVELVNNLMSSQKVSERALKCAALPTVEEFYRLYENVGCFRFPERSDIILPRITFGQIREDYLRVARSRSDVFDYRHCMRSLHGLIEQIHHSPKIEVNVLGELLLKVMSDINGLRDRELLLH